MKSFISAMTPAARKLFERRRAFECHNLTATDSIIPESRCYRCDLLAGQHTEGVDL
jgi:hypothetical protein